ncbi:hypothetical protein ACOMHN_054751 [Nucella lapillus]
METNLGAKSEFFAWNDGRRIVDLQELAKQLHCKQCSSLLDLQRTERETRYGFASVLYIHCSCGLMNDVHTSKVQQNEDSQKSSTPVFEINSRASINLLMYGSSPILSFLALLDVPVPASNDASVALPSDLASLSHVPPALPSIPTVYTPPSSTPPTKAASSSSFSSSQKALPLPSDLVVSSVPETLASVSGGDNSTAVQVSCNDDGECVRDIDHREYDDHLQDNNVFSEEEDVEGFNEDVVYDEDDEEYIPPPTKVKSRLKPKPTPSSSKKKAAPRKSRKARVKKSPEKKKPPVKRSPVKKTKPQGKVKTLKINLKSVSTERAVKETEDQEEGEEKGRENSRTNSDNPMEWSCEESERESAADKLSGDSQTEEEQSAKDGDEEEEARPRRKRGRPKGSTDRAKRLRKSAGRVVVVDRDCEPSGEEAAVPICTACGREFNSIKGYNVHMKRVHNQDMKGARGGRAREGGPGVEPAVPEAVRAELYVCSFCCQPFARHYTALSHIRHKHWSPMLQPQESYVTVQLGSTIRKMPTKKAKVHGLFTCTLCSSRTMTREAMAGHICVGRDCTLSCVNTCPSGGKKLLYLEMNYLLTDKQGYLCHTCGDVFKVAVHLDTHLLKVHGVLTDRHKRCQCQFCGSTFSLPSHVKKHILHKHSDLGDDPASAKARTFRCDLCGKEYDRADSMMVHKRRRHTEGKRFQCEYCPKRFFGRSHWLDHTRQHFGASKHVCRWCSQQFSSGYALRVHQRRHTGERPYRCKVCGACFAQKTSLTVHMKKHQKGEPSVGRAVQSKTVRVCDALRTAGRTVQSSAVRACDAPRTAGSTLQSSVVTGGDAPRTAGSTLQSSAVRGGDAPRTAGMQSSTVAGGDAPRTTGSTVQSLAVRACDTPRTTGGQSSTVRACDTPRTTGSTMQSSTVRACDTPRTTGMQSSSTVRACDTPRTTGSTVQSSTVTGGDTPRTRGSSSEDLDRPQAKKTSDCVVVSGWQERPSMAQLVEEGICSNQGGREYGATAHLSPVTKQGRPGTGGVSDPGVRGGALVAPPLAHHGRSGGGKGVDGGGRRALTASLQRRADWPPPDQDRMDPANHPLPSRDRVSRPHPLPRQDRVSRPHPLASQDIESRPHPLPRQDRVSRPHPLPSQDRVSRPHPLSSRDRMDTADHPLPSQDIASRPQKGGGQGRTTNMLPPSLHPPFPPPHPPPRLDRPSPGSINGVYASLKQPSPPPPPPRRTPHPALHTNASQELSPGRDLEEGGDFFPSGYERVDAPPTLGREGGVLLQDSRWPPRGFVRSAPVDGRRVEGGGAVCGGSLRPPEDPRPQPTVVGQVSGVGARPRRRGKDDGGDDGSDWRCVKEEDVRECLYLCPVCHQLYSQAKCLAVHLKKVHQTAPLNVDDYGISMEGSVQKLTLAWKNHQRSLFKCLTCQTTMESRLRFGAHVRLQADQARVTCEALNPGALRLGTYQSQLFLRENDDHQRHLCHICGAEFKKKYILKQHVNTHDEACPQTLVCQLCPYSTTDAINFQHHKWKKHPTKPRVQKHMCEVCGKSFFYRSAMESHVEGVHLKNKALQCQLCFKVFKYTRGYEKHMRNHRSTPSHECLHCSRRFNQAYNLKVHERLHTGEKPYQCKFCHAAFAQKNSLNVHMKKHQKIDGIAVDNKPFPAQNLGSSTSAENPYLHSQKSQAQERVTAGTGDDRHSRISVMLGPEDDADVFVKK